MRRSDPQRRRPSAPPVDAPHHRPVDRGGWRGSAKPAKPRHNPPPPAPLDGSQARPPHASVASSDTTRMLAFILDELIRVPGTRFRFGLDPILGFIPGLGDAAGSAISGIILVEGIRQRVPYSVLLRMGGNLLIDGLLGLLPFIGDAADAAHRANSKNVRLLDRTVARGQRVQTDGIGYLLGAGAIVVLILAAVIGLAVLGVLALLRVLGIV
ncbi:hypothetical protein BJY21_002284 [Kineosphaera limosa]|uniref:DUF4112 domain-containing protein n=1 Tax=Kineosphaera limosa NBRC 100340 TaxID=1184609 RepID=K6WD72_9MICO|nr:DUF4112 domain-containing protein [Kineosphaera limosa]NYE01100.1 hypothetical protein [Kineosphaera limosa]GAB97225.1 hypothetical protein KILIM_061_00090 [Kineosphaera limosa NBRC 100340]